GRHIRLAGEDRRPGDRVADDGAVLSPERLAAIASAGVGELRVSRRPRAVVVSTGDELVEPGAALARGQIPDSNALLVSLLAGDAGAVVATDHAVDRPGALSDVIERHRRKTDVIVIT